MRVRPDWIEIAAWAAALVVAGCVAAAAVRAGNWDPVYRAGWLVPVIAGAASANRTGYCLPRRRPARRAGQGRAAG